MPPSLKTFELVAIRTEWQQGRSGDLASGYFVDRQTITFVGDDAPRTRAVTSVQCRTLDELETIMAGLAPSMWEQIRDGFPDDGPAPGVRVRARMPTGARRPAGFKNRFEQGFRYLPDGTPITSHNLEQAVATPAQEAARG